jgi:hypothetical protein
MVLAVLATAILISVVVLILNVSGHHLGAIGRNQRHEPIVYDDGAWNFAAYKPLSTEPDIVAAAAEDFELWESEQRQDREH